MNKVIPAILLLFFSVSTLKLQTTNGRIQIVKENSNELLCNVQVNLEGDSSNIGNFVNRINFNPSALSFPSQPEKGIDYWSSNTAGGKYFYSVTQPAKKTVSINVVHMDGAGIPIGEQYVGIATLKFAREDPFAENGLQFGLRQFFEPYSSNMWKNGIWSVSSLSEEYVPKLISPFNNEIAKNQNIVFSWQKIENANKYHLEISLDPIFSKIVYSINDITNNQFILKNIVEGTRYYWRVRSFKQESPSHYSKTASFVVTISKPKNFVISSYNDQFIQLTWENTCTSGRSIIIERKEGTSEESEFNVIDTIDANRTTFIDSRIKSNIQYLYRIFVINKDSFSEFSDTTDMIMSVKDVEEQNNIPTEFKLEQNYPNPFNPQTNISYALKENSEVKIVVYSVLGEKVASLVDEFQNAGIYEIVWDASNYPSGIYVYIMTAKSKVTDHTFQNVKKMILVK